MKNGDRDMLFHGQTVVLCLDYGKISNVLKHIFSSIKQYVLKKLLDKA